MNDEAVARMKMEPLKLSDEGKRIVKRGGADGDANDDDGMLIKELIAAAPGCTMAEYGELFIALRMEYGFDARDALATGHVKFVERPREPGGDVQ